MLKLLVAVSWCWARTGVRRSLFLYARIHSSRKLLLFLIFNFSDNIKERDAFLMFVQYLELARIVNSNPTGVPRREFWCQCDQRLTCRGYETYSMFLYTWLRLPLLECCLHMIHVRLVICRDKVIRRTSRRQPAVVDNSWSGQEAKPPRSSFK